MMLRPPSLPSCRVQTQSFRIVMPVTGQNLCCHFTEVIQFSPRLTTVSSSQSVRSQPKKNQKKRRREGQAEGGARLRSPCLAGRDRLVSQGTPVGGAQCAEDWVLDRPPCALLLLRVAIHLGGDVLPAAETDPHCGAATSRRAVLAPREEVAACTLRGRALVVRALFVFEEARATKAALAATLLALLLLWRVHSIVARAAWNERG